MSRPANPVTVPLADYSPQHFLLAVVDGVAQPRRLASRYAVFAERLAASHRRALL